MSFLGRIRASHIYFALFIFGYGVFYFFLRNKLPFTPDFQGSDAFHLNVSLKYYLWQSLRSGFLPFWTEKLAGGFPLIAETQIGAFFLPHLLLFPLFSNFSHVYMLLFAGSLFLLSSGMYLVLRQLKVSSLLSFLLALTFTWCGAVSFRWVHFNFLETFSLVPILFWAYLKWNESGKKRYAFFMSFFICQMIFAGHMQTTFNFLFGLSLVHLLFNFPLRLKKNISYFCIVLFGFILAAPQIAPTILLSHYTQRGFANSYQYIVYLLFNMKDIIGFYSAKAVGSPQTASYFLGAPGNRVYWENTPYLGELFVILLLLSSVFYFIRYKKLTFVRTFLLLSILFLLLAFGGDSPIYFVFGMFPFSIFRTPAKYLLDCVFFLILYSALIFQEVIKKQKFLLLLVYSALIVNCFILIRSAFYYHVFVDAQSLFTALKQFSVQQNPSSRYIDLGVVEKWYDTFRTKGWNTKQKIETYLFLNSGLLPNSNLITGASNFDIDTGGLRMRRTDYIKSIVLSSLADFSNTLGDDDSRLKFTQFLELYNIGTVISLRPLSLPNFKESQTQKNGDLKLIVSNNAHLSGNIFYVPSDVHSFTYIEDVEKELAKETVSEAHSFAENLPKEVRQSNQNISIMLKHKDDRYVQAQVVASEAKFLGAKVGWYPEWHLFIDGKENPVYKTNLIQIGFFVPKGKHLVELRYIPTSFYLGCGIAILGLLITSGVGILLFKKHSG